MKIKWAYILTAVALAITWLLLPGCSGRNPQTAPPVTVQDANPVSPSGGHQLWGYWLIGIDPEANQYEVFPVRQVETHWNVIKWLEQDPCTDCFKITSFANSDHGTKLVTVRIEHPFPNPNLTGFDVRGIAMFNGSYEFSTSGLTTSDRSLGDPELINADGFTTLYNSSTAGSGPGGLQGYLKGKFATATMPNAMLNGFKRYISSGAANTRNAFYAGDTYEKVYDIAMPGSPFIIGYAVDASWAPPTNKPVTDPMNDFPPEANCYEPYSIELQQTSGMLTTLGGHLHFRMSVDDHQGPDSHADPVLECTQVTDTFGLYESSPDGYSFYVSNSAPAPPGVYKLLVSIEDNLNSESDPWINLTAYQIHTFQVYQDQGWAKTWGGSNWDRGNAVAIDGTGCQYVAGHFQGTVDFDPGPGVVERISNAGSIDAFVSAFDSVGNLAWVKTWGGSGVDSADDIDASTNIVVVGSFEGSVDFNPEGSSGDFTSNGGTDAYMIYMIADDGHYSLGKTWGGPENDDASSVLNLNSGRVMVTGSFKGTVEFPNGQEVTSQGGADIYLLDAWSTHNLLGTYGGTGDDTGNGMVVLDGNVLLVGSFMDDVTFGPYGTRHSAGSADAYLARYEVEADGAPVFQWVVTWGDTAFDTCNAVCYTPVQIYATGSYSGTVDFDPGGATDNRTSSGFADAYVCHYSAGGGYQGVRTWGGSDALLIDSGQDVTTDSDGNVYVAGSFFGEAFGIPSNGGFDGVVARYDQNLIFINWTDVIGGPQADGCNGIAVDYWGRVFVTGSYKETVDFDPTAGVDNQTYNGGQSDCFLLKMYSNGLW